MAKKRSGGNSSNSGCATFIGVLIIIGIVGAIIEVVARWLYKNIPSLLTTPVLVGVIIVFVAVLVFVLYRVKVNHYAKKHRMETADLAGRVLAATSLKDYYENRDCVIPFLEKMKKGEWLTKKKYFFDNKKPSDLLHLFVDEEEELTHLTILNIINHMKSLMKECGPNTLSRYDTDLQQYKSRMSLSNQSLAETGRDLLFQYSKIVGTIEEADGMEGHEFEHWCADLLQKNGYTQVVVTPGSGDQGVDITAKMNGISYAVQCKCYTSDLGNAPVQEVNAGKTMYGCQIGAVMTNRYFTKGAKDLAKATGTLLWDRDKLIEMLELAQAD